MAQSHQRRRLTANCIKRGATEVSVMPPHVAVPTVVPGFKTETDHALIENLPSILAYSGSGADSPAASA